MTSSTDRRARLARAHLYFVTDAATDPAVLRGALGGGADMLQLRDAAASDEELLRAAALFRALCDEHGALFWLNDRPDLASRAAADGVHLGQDDMPVRQARALVGDGLLIGLSTHSAQQLEAGIAAGADQLSVGPVWETPTKPGRPATGLEYVRHAARRRPPVPWFAIGGIASRYVSGVVAAGATRAVVARAIRDAPEHRAAAAELRAALLERTKVGAEQ